MALTSVLEAVASNARRGAKRGAEAAPQSSSRTGRAAEKSANALGRAYRSIADFVKAPGEALGLSGAGALVGGAVILFGLWKYAVPAVM